MPLVHPPGHAPGHVQADFGKSDAIIAGVKLRAHFFVMTLPHSAACFVVAYPAATVEAWLDGHNKAFAFFGGVPRSILYDNDKCLASRILPDGRRQRTRSFSELQSHYLFEDRYGRPGKGKRQARLPAHPERVGRIVFLDETSINTKMARLRGRCPSGQRMVAAIPHGHWKTMTFIAGLRGDGLTAPWVP